MPRQRVFTLAGLLLALAAGPALPACGDDDSDGGQNATAGENDPGSTATQGSSAAKSPQVEALPASVQSAYEMFDGPVGPSPYSDFKPKQGPPWTIGYASSYAGNTWRSTALDELQNVLVPKYQEAGLVDKMLVTQSNLKDSVQIQQVRQLISQGADVILLCCPSTALNPVIKFARSQGVPVVAFTGHATDPGAVSVYANDVKSGYDQARFVGEQMGGKGNLLYVNGIPGQSVSDSVDKGVNAALEEYPDIELVGTVSGSWTDQIAKAEVLKFLATHPQPIDGVVVQSAQEIGVMQAFQQAGRPLPPMTIGGEKGAACYWTKNPDFKTRLFNFWPPAREADAAMSVMIRILQGQGPKIQSITRSPTQSDLAEVRELVPPDCDVNDSSWIHPDDWFSEEYLNNFFERGKPPLGQGE
jgi:ribose transport system substrate-binding protein